MANDSGNEDNWLYGDANIETSDPSQSAESTPAKVLQTDEPPGTETENAVSIVLNTICIKHNLIYFYCHE